ncbi:MAG: hypothetical protein ACRD4C_09080 [Candidatus Acidiferrales bacterium]
MAQSILIFDFGTNEEAAQQARHKVEGWQQGFRLGKKILLKFDRGEPAEEGAGRKDEQDQAAEGKEPGEKKSAAVAERSAADERIRLLIRLDFSGHEKLSQQQWLNRIPSEEPFKSAKGETIHHNDAAFAKTAERFDSLD